VRGFIEVKVDGATGVDLIAIDAIVRLRSSELGSVLYLQGSAAPLYLADEAEDLRKRIEEARR
jgi:hypothetical protein